jgi:hypothetical protein
MEQFYDIMELLYDKRSITLLLVKVLVINKLINKEMILVKVKVALFSNISNVKF